MQSTVEGAVENGNLGKNGTERIKRRMLIISFLFSLLIYGCADEGVPHQDEGAAARDLLEVVEAKLHLDLPEAKVVNSYHRTSYDPILLVKVLLPFSGNEKVEEGYLNGPRLNLRFMMSTLRNVLHGGPLSRETFSSKDKLKMRKA